jgi:diguanylate cyclase (GGDEF)-like protein/PAS domain S-box-containing protein
VSPYAQWFTNPEHVIDRISAIRWSLTDRAVDQADLRTVAGSPFAGPDAVAALFALDGRVLAVEPGTATVPIDPNDPAWQAALRGRGANTPVLAVGGEFRRFALVPIRRDGHPVALVAVGPSLTKSFPAALARALGATRGTGGGISTVDSAGRASLTWNPALVGAGIADPGELARIRPGQIGRLPAPPDSPQTITLATPIPPPAGGYLVLQQPTAEFFGGLSPGQSPNRILVGIVAVTIGGLAATNRRRERNLRRDAARLGTLLHHAHDIVLVLGRDDRLAFVSSAIEGLLGHHPDVVLGRPLTDLVHPEDVWAVLAARGRAGPAPVPDIRLRTAAGDHRWFDIEVARLGAGQYAGCVLLTCHDITERRDLEQELHRRVRHDTLTGLPNRAALAHHLAEIARRHPVGTDFAVLLIDLDNFKPINDAHGHGAGDEVLAAVAARLTSAVGERGTAFRHGGDEFVVILPEADMRTARVASMHLRNAIRTPVAVGGTSLTLDAAIGVALSRPDDDVDPEAVVRRADAAMYQVKRVGRDR